VLLVDDEPNIRRFLCAGFELEGCDVLEAANAAVALRIATFNSPDLIVLDPNLPDLPGAEVLERIRSLLRRYFKAAAENAVVIAGPLSVNFVTREVLLDQKPIGLTRKEYRLLHILATHLGLVVTHDQLLNKIWTGQQRENIQYLRILVRKLRQKIETDPDRPRLLITESGVGYRLQSRLEAASGEG
jgi:two-component system, OmpR family, KDP operon response regulator KdpE